MACKVCKRDIPVLAEKRGGSNLLYCRPPEGRRESRCQLIARGYSLARNQMLRLHGELEAEGASPEELSAFGQSMKSYAWKELNAATNLGKLSKQRS